MEDRFDYASITEIKNLLEVSTDVTKFSFGRDGTVYLWGEFLNKLTERTVIAAVKSVDSSFEVVLNPPFKGGPPWEN